MEKLYVCTQTYGLTYIMAYDLACYKKRPSCRTMEIAHRIYIKMYTHDLCLHIVKLLILISTGMFPLHRAIKPVCIDGISVCLMGMKLIQNRTLKISRNWS